MLLADWERERVYLHHNVIKNRVLLSLRACILNETVDIPLNLKEWPTHSQLLCKYLINTKDIFRFLFYNEPGVFSAWSIEYRTVAIPVLQQLFNLMLEERLEKLSTALKSADLLMTQIIQCGPPVTIHSWQEAELKMKNLSECLSRSFYARLIPTQDTNNR